MIGYAMYISIITLWKQNKSKREISRILGHDRNTVRRIIKIYEETGHEVPVKTHKSSIIDLHHDKIVTYLEENLTIIRIYEKLLEEGVKVSYSGVRRYVSNIKIDKKICVRFHTDPGAEAQVDFGYVGRFPDKNSMISKCYVFSMRLSYSRLDYYECVFDQKVETFIRCHINAFRYFGGVVKTVKIDNLKSAILEANFYEPTYQSLYKNFADYYSFFPLPCRVRKPQEKGKVENGIRYIQINFFAGRKFNSNQELNIALRNWLDNKCNVRLHGTTKKIPREVFDNEEKALLQPLPISDFIFPNIVCRKVSKDCHITFANNYYSVPYEYINKIVEISLDTKLIKITYNQDQVAIHEKCEGKGNFITNKSHYPKYKLYEPNSSEYQTKYQKKLELIGEHAGIVFSKLLSIYPHTWYNMVKGILSLEKQYSKEIINLACKRAIEFDAISYQKIKAICVSGCYVLPIDNNKTYNN
jgi:transposase